MTDLVKGFLKRGERMSELIIAYILHEALMVSEKETIVQILSSCFGTNLHVYAPVSFKDVLISSKLLISVCLTLCWMGPLPIFSSSPPACVLHL